MLAAEVALPMLAAMHVLAPHITFCQISDVLSAKLPTNHPVFSTPPVQGQLRAASAATPTPSATTAWLLQRVMTSQLHLQGHSLCSWLLCLLLPVWCLPVWVTCCGRQLQSADVSVSSRAV